MAKPSRDLEKRLRNLEAWLNKATAVEPVMTHIRDEEGRINPPLTEEEVRGKKPVVVAQVVDGRCKQQ